LKVRDAAGEPLRQHFREKPFALRARINKRGRPEREK
jgi:hypothetical protein